MPNLYLVTFTVVTADLSHARMRSNSMFFRIFFWVQHTESPINGFFILYWEFTTQLNFSIYGKLYFASCPKLWALEILLVSPVLPFLGFRKELLDSMHEDFSKSSGIVLYQLTHPLHPSDFGLK